MSAVIHATVASCCCWIATDVNLGDNRIMKADVVMKLRNNTGWAGREGGPGKQWESDDRTEDLEGRERMRGSREKWRVGVAEEENRNDGGKLKR